MNNRNIRDGEEKMPSLNNFINDFQKDHSELLNLLTSFRDAIESSNTDGAREILSKIETIASGHFNFEETYLYPRLRRLVLEITQNLGSEQQIMREFIRGTRSFLDKNKLDKNKLTNLLDMLPRLFKLFEDCNDLVFLVEKFSKEDKEDLERRFKECCKTKSLIAEEV